MKIHQRLLLERQKAQDEIRRNRTQRLIEQRQKQQEEAKRQSELRQKQLEIQQQQQQLEMLEQQKQSQIKERGEWETAREIILAGKEQFYQRSPLSSKIRQLREQGLESFEAMKKSSVVEIDNEKLNEIQNRIAEMQKSKQQTQIQQQQSNLESLGFQKNILGLQVAPKPTQQFLIKKPTILEKAKIVYEEKVKQPIKEKIEKFREFSERVEEWRTKGKEQTQETPQKQSGYSFSPILLLSTGIEKAGSYFIEKLPESETKQKIKKVWETPAPSGLVKYITDTEKFLFFAPFMGSTAKVTSELIEQEVITPISQTKFFSEIMGEGNVKEIGLVSETEIAGRKAGAISRQKVIELGDKYIFGGEEGYIINSQTGELILTRFKGVGAGSQLGEAKAISKGSLDVVYDIGTGAKGRTFTQDIFSLKIDKRLGAIDKFKIKKVYEKLLQGDVTGIISEPIESGSGIIYKFAGAGYTPTKVLTKTGFKLRIPTEDINIRGLIFETQTADKKVFEIAGEQLGLSSGLKQSVLKSVSSATSQSEKALIKELSNFPKTITSEISLITQIKQQQKTDNLIKQELLTKEKTKQKPSQILNLNQIEKQEFNILSKQKIDLVTKLKQKQKLKQKSLLKELTIQRTLKSQRQRFLLNQISNQINKSVNQKIKTPIIFSVPKKTTKRKTLPLILPMLYRTKKEKDLFKILVKRYGKFKEYDVAQNYEGALLKAQKSLVEGLGATAKIIPTTKFNFDRIIKEPKGFRFGRIEKGKQIYNPLLLIQKNEKRLSTTAEKLEIKLAKLKFKI